VYKIVVDADGLIKLGKAGVLALLLESFEVLIPEAVYEEAVVIGKLELYEDAFALEKVLERGPARRLEARLDPRAGRILQGVTELGKGERESLHIYHAEEANAVFSDDRVFLRLLEDNAVPYLTPAGLIVRLFEVGRLDRGEALAALDKLERHIRGSVYERAK
jgi:predicted nucleic acid-binding protein